jgi:hypothetical protein
MGQCRFVLVEPMAQPFECWIERDDHEMRRCGSISGSVPAGARRIVFTTRPGSIRNRKPRWDGGRARLDGAAVSTSHAATRYPARPDGDISFAGRLLAHQGRLAATSWGAGTPRGGGPTVSPDGSTVPRSTSCTTPSRRSQRTLPGAERRDANVRRLARQHQRCSAPREPPRWSATHSRGRAPVNCARVASVRHARPARSVNEGRPHDWSHTN